MQSYIQKPLIIAQIQVNLTAIIQDIYFTWAE